MIPSQMLKGLLEGAILEVIRGNETYAYEISNHLETFGFGEISEGTIYPIILRLQKNQYITGENRPSPSGPKRKYYRLTPAGFDYLDTFKTDWHKLQSAMRNLLKGDDGV
ncbi:MAG TPA: PadR family transcriptional regulator [Tissierellia bacterium]|nr:PadR family transcriptional regulator [Tissierellia bacterium]